MTLSIRFGTLGAAAITPGALVAPASDRDDVKITATAARDRSRAEAFAAEHGIRDVLDSYRQVVEHPEVNAVYNPLPIHLHKEWTIAALRAGKHVLCEKPFACNAAEAEEMARVARETGLVLMEAMHSRHHPLFARAAEIVASGVLGPVSRFEGWLNVDIREDDDLRRRYELGGGALMDLGVYPLTWACFLLGERPQILSARARARTGNPNVDIGMDAELRYPSGASGHISCAMSSDRKHTDNAIVVEGMRGTLRVLNPLVPQYGHKIELTIDGVTREETQSRRSSYAYQLDAFVDAVVAGGEILTDADSAVSVMHLVDDCYRGADLPLRGLRLT